MEAAARDPAKFECNICIEVAHDPVVTRCGHLYWETLSCPVCKSGVTLDTLIPLFTREENSAPSSGPQRPRPERSAPVQNSHYNPFRNLGQVFGFTGRAEAPQVAAGYGYFPGVFGLAALECLNKLMIILGLVIVLAVLFS